MRFSPTGSPGTLVFSEQISYLALNPGNPRLHVRAVRGCYVEAPVRYFLAITPA